MSGRSRALFWPAGRALGLLLVLVLLVGSAPSPSSATCASSLVTSVLTGSSSLCTDDTLSSFAVTGASLSFSADTLGYSVTVPAAVSTVVGTAVVDDLTATLSWSPSTAILTGLVVGVPQTISVTVTAESGATKVYYANVTRLSGDSSLASLTPSSSSLSPNFSSSTYAYTLGAAYEVQNVSFAYATSFKSASVALVWSPSSAADMLPTGSSTLTLTVTSQDGLLTASYIVVVTKALASCSVSAPSHGSLGGCSQTLSSGSSCSFTCDANYTLVGTSTTCVAGVLTAQTCISATSTISSYATISSLIVYSVDSSNVTRTAFAETGLTTLISSFYVGVVHNVTSVKLAVVTQKNATYGVTGSTGAIVWTALTSGVASSPLALAVGSNVFPIVVTTTVTTSGNKDSTTTTTYTSNYTVTVVRAASTDARLASLQPSSGALSPAFTSTNLLYAVGLAWNVSSVAFVGQASDSTGATLTWSPSTANVSVAQAASTTVSVTVRAADGLTSLTYTVVVSRAAAPCSVTTPEHGSLNTCSSQLASGTTCSIACNATEKYVVSGVSTTCLYGQLTSSQTCVSSNANLATLTFDHSARFTFNPTQTTYDSAFIRHAYSGTNASATPQDANATIAWIVRKVSGLEPYPAVGQTISLLVTAPSGAFQTYSIYVRRLPSTRLLGLATAPKSVMAPAFVVDASTRAFNATPRFAYASVALNATLETGAGETIQVTWTPSSAATELPLYPSTAVANLTVISRDDLWRDAYFITVSRPPQISLNITCLDLLGRVLITDASVSTELSAGQSLFCTLVPSAAFDGLLTVDLTLTNGGTVSPSTLNFSSNGDTTVASQAWTYTVDEALPEGDSPPVLVTFNLAGSAADQVAAHSDLTLIVSAAAILSNLTVSPVGTGLSPALGSSRVYEVNFTADVTTFNLTAIGTISGDVEPVMSLWYANGTTIVASLASGVSSPLLAIAVDSRVRLVLGLSWSLSSTAQNFYSLVLRRPPWTIVAAPTVTITGAPTSMYSGDALSMTASVTTSSQTAASDLTYRWNCTTHPWIDLTDTRSVITSSANSPMLSFNTSYSLAAGSYVFVVTVRDSASTHRTKAGLVPTGSGSSKTTVRAAVSLVVTTNTTTDPCTTNSPCENGGTCSSQVISETTDTSTGSVVETSTYTYLLTCTCPTSPYAYYGPTCSFGLLSCVNCISAFLGGTEMTLLGVGLDAVTGIAVAGNAVTVNGPTTANSSDATVSSLLAATGLSAIDQVTFITPALVTVANDTNTTDGSNDTDESTSALITPFVTASVFSSPSSSSHHLSLSFATSVNPTSSYEVVTVTLELPGSTTSSQLNYTKLLYYSSSTCLTAGVFQPNGYGGCTACPTGGYCPGGGRCWPLSGYWSYTEYQSPLACSFADACPGIDADETALSSSDTSVSYVDTQVCSAGYEGTRCQSCADGYYQLNSRCYYCGSSTDQSTALALTILVALAAMGALSVAVAVLPSVPLAHAAQVFVVLQEVAQIGVEGASELPVYAEQVSAVFTYLNFINFDLEILKPGCAGIPTFNYVTKFRYTLLFMFVTACFFFVACVARLIWKTRRVRQIGVIGDDAAVLEDEDSDDEEGEEEEGTTAVVRSNTVIVKASSFLHRLVKSVAAFRPRAFMAQFMKDTPWIDFKQRLQHAMLILLSIFYLQLTILQFKAFKCALEPNPVEAEAGDVVVTEALYLTEDLQTLCYHGDHLTTVVFVAFLFVFYTVGFPLLCFLVLTRAFANESTGGPAGWLWRRVRWFRGKRKRLRLSIWMRRRRESGADAAASDEKPVGTEVPPPPDALQVSKSATTAPPGPTPEQIHRERLNRYGYLFCGVRAEHFAWCTLMFGVSIWTAAVTVYVDSSSTLSMFLFGIMWTAQTIAVAVHLPYHAWTENLQKVVIGLGTLAHSTVLLAVQTDGTESAYFYVLLILFSIIICLTMVRRKLPCFRRAVKAVERQEALEAFEALQAMNAMEASRVRAGSKAGLLSPGDHDEPSSVISRTTRFSTGATRSRVKVAPSEMVELSKRGRSSTDVDESGSTDPPEHVLERDPLALEREVARLARLAASAMRDASKRACALPSSLLHLLCHALDDCQTVEALSSRELARIVADAIDEYERAAVKRIEELRMETDDDNDAAKDDEAFVPTLTAPLRLKISQHLTTRINEWAEVAHVLRDGASGGSHSTVHVLGRAPPRASALLASAVESLEASEEFATGLPSIGGVDLASSLVSHLRAVEGDGGGVFVSVLLQLSCEAKASARLWSDVERTFRRQKDERHAATAERALPPPVTDDIITQIEREEDDEAAFESLRTGAVRLAADRLEQARQTDDAPLVEKLVSIHRDLLDPTCFDDATPIPTAPLTADDAALVASLQEGRSDSERVRRILHRALQNEPLARLLRLATSERSHSLARVLASLRASEVSREDEQRLRQARRNLGLSPAPLVPRTLSPLQTPITPNTPTTTTPNCFLPSPTLAARRTPDLASLRAPSTHARTTPLPPLRLAASYATANSPVLTAAVPLSRSHSSSHSRSPRSPVSSRPVSRESLVRLVPARVQLRARSSSSSGLGGGGGGGGAELAPEENSLNSPSDDTNEHVRPQQQRRHRHHHHAAAASMSAVMPLIQGSPLTGAVPAIASDLPTDLQAPPQARASLTPR